jgi:predicted enzyme related to lactoylglutathione lyase
MPGDMRYKGDLTCAMEVADRRATASWYESVLGFRLLYDAAEIGWCEMASPVENVSVGFSEVESPQVRGGATLVFGVEDIDAARGRLEAQRVRFDGDTMTVPGLVRLATFFDPDGHKLMLSQSLQR